LVCGGSSQGLSLADRLTLQRFELFNHHGGILDRVGEGGPNEQAFDIGLDLRQPVEPVLDPGKVQREAEPDPMTGFPL
jgi:hypothetical protein